MITQQWTEDQIALRDRATRSPGFFRDPAKIENAKIQNQPNSRPGREVSARVFPNGEFGVGYVPRKGISAKERRYEEERRYAEDNAYYDADIEINADMPEGFIYTRKLVMPLPPKLGIGAESSQEARKYGLNGITAHGRKMLRSAGHIMDTVAKSGGGYYPQMGTLTIPSLEPERMMEICRNWSDIVRRFFQECRRRYARFGKIFDYASCTEIQPGRWVDRGEVGLHVHFLFVAFRINRKLWSLPDQWVRDVWRRILVYYVGEGGVPHNLNYRRETVRQSSAAYIAKYASKGAEFIKEVAERVGREALPSQWWSISSRLRTVIKRHTILSTGTTAELLLSICREDMTDYLKYKREITLKVYPNEYAASHNCPEEILLGYGGMLSPAGFAFFTPDDYNRSIIKNMHTTLDRCPMN